MTLLLLAGGLVLLVLGAELLVRGASRLAGALGISPLVIGLTVVAYGTSMPEMAVSVTSSLGGQADLALGNVVGSNIFNVLLILGLSALIAPLTVSRQLVRLDVPLMIFVSVLTLLLSADGRIGRFEGLGLFAGAVAYTVFLIRQGRKEGRETRDAEAGEDGDGGSPAHAARDVGLIAAGLGLLVLGSKWLVSAAVAIAAALGVAELIIGLTVVAAGTSLPEVATSVVASLRGERDIAVGNVVGSNIFNLLAVLGLSSLASPEGVAVAASALRFDLLVMIAVAVACLPILFTGHFIARWEGALFLGVYVAYTLYLVLDASRHASAALFGAAMLWFVVPLTALTLAVTTLRALRCPAAPGSGTGGTGSPP